MGTTTSAVEQYRQVIAPDGKDAMAFNSLAHVLAETKRPDEAMQYAQKALEFAPDNAAVEDTVGWVYYQQGLSPLAVVRHEAANAGKGTAVRKYHLAMAYLKAGNAERGRQTLDDALRINSTLPEAQAARKAFGIGPN